MRYLLTVLTNGRPDYLRTTLVAFQDLVTPQPSDVYIFDDGLRTPPEAFAGWEDARIEGSPYVSGMCRAHASCWDAAARSDLGWAFHLEDDMRILCPIDLTDLEAVLGAEPHLKQMALMRTPWGAEVEHGGYVQQTPGWYIAKQNLHGARWFETARNWSCAPSLFRTETARAFPWSPEPGCETEIGPRMIDGTPGGAHFGIWGGGEIQVAHIGVERALGARGY